ncbi:UPF0426 protein [Canna indica]|uniref:UPF0426 protein n=1 Tax=Canna indica TaxID=4628 RepID=A0AAQ3QIW9_9LILI|nr:UPF0426 protein [Canna indica]
MALLLNSSLVPMKWENRFFSLPLAPSITKRRTNSVTNRRKRSAVAVKGIESFLNPLDDPILKDAVKVVFCSSFDPHHHRQDGEPVAFLGGVFAGLLRLDLKEDPLREWVSKTAEAAGIAGEGEIDAEGDKMGGEDDGPQQIEIE